MPDWSSLRSHARAVHRLLCFRTARVGVPLPDADTLLSMAAEETGIEAYPLPPDDALLAGAHALLDRDAGCIWYASASGGSTPQSRFARAHEYAHWWLHPEIGRDEFFAAEEAFALTGTGQTLPALQVAEGYGPQERREQEANLFAAELLLPIPILHDLVRSDDWNAARVVAHCGLSESLVFAQLAEALLLPLPFAEEATTEVAASVGVPLDSSQRAAAQASPGPLLVDAGPGTGKTRTLIARLLWLIQECHVAPDQILALTFSNLAAEEIRTRLRREVGSDANRVWIGTFHSFGLELLRKEGERIGLPAVPRLIDPSEAVTLLEQHLDRLPLREFEFLFRPSLPFPDILSCISRAKDECCSPADYLRLAEDQKREAGGDERKIRAARKSIEVAGIYAVYEHLLSGYGLIDFGDLLMRAVDLLDRYPEVTRRWQQQYRHILADEYQDVNRASALLLRRLAGSGEGFWAVGDLRQAIYRFRGASPANVRDFDLDFPGARRQQLEQNYRSAPDLVDLFGRFASDMSGPGAEPTVWEAKRKASSLPSLLIASADDEEAQADHIARQVRDYAASGISPGEQTILCHTNRQATEMAARLEKRGITTQHLGDLFRRDEIKDLLALIALACEPDGSSLARIARAPIYDVPLEDIKRLIAAARADHLPFPAALKLVSDLPDLSVQGREGLERLQSELQPCLYRGDAWSLLCRYLFDTGSYLRPLLSDRSSAGAQRRLAISQLLVLAQGLTRRLPPAEGQTAHAAFLINLRHRLACGQDRLTSPPSLARDLDGVRLMTIHQSKGLEFPVVYLPDLIEGQYPPRKGAHMAAPPPGLGSQDGAQDLPDEQASEDCLFFVAISRARDHLILSHPQTWRGKPARPCTLLKRIEATSHPSAPQRIQWPALSAPMPEPVGAPESVAPASHDPEPVYSLSALEQYQRCPRLFYYQRKLRLPQPDGDSAYLLFHRGLDQAIQWLSSERAAGRDPNKSESITVFEAACGFREGEAESAQARLLRRRGIALIEQMHTAPTPALRQRGLPDLVAHLDHGSVRIACDQSEDPGDGTLRLIDRRTGRPGDDDHTEPKLALMRHAARQQNAARPVQIVLDYLQSGEQKEVKESKRFEPNRVAKYDAALRAIYEGRFDPDPETRKCAVCPYFIICPK